MSKTFSKIDKALSDNKTNWMQVSKETREGDHKNYKTKTKRFLSWSEFDKLLEAAGLVLVKKQDVATLNDLQLAGFKVVRVGEK